MDIQTDTYFVIMRRSGTEWIFFCQKDGVVWLNDPEEAIRFCREIDAERMRLSLGTGGLNCQTMECKRQCAQISNDSGHTNNAQFAGQFNEPIPVDVYYSWESNSFYDRLTKKGMGTEFFRNWMNRAGEFPKEPV